MLHVTLTARRLAMRASTLAELGVAGIVLAASWASWCGAQRILVDLSIRPPLQKADCDLGLPERPAGWLFEDVRWQPRARSDAESLGWWWGHSERNVGTEDGSSAYPQSLCVLWRQMLLQTLDGNNGALS